MGAHPDAHETMPGGRIPSQMASVKLKMLNEWLGILGTHAHVCGERPNSSCYPFLACWVNLSTFNWFFLDKNITLFCKFNAFRIYKVNAVKIRRR
jgi:hypothetical protein